MYPNLEAEMARKKITRNALAKELDVTPTTMGKKLNGETVLSLPDCIKIKNYLGVSMDLEYLFAEQDE